jgi:CheY-like chemotaxis protein
MPKMMPKIMIVEDEQIVALDLRNTLRGFGYPDTVLVASGEDAVKEASVSRPDLVLMDIVLEGPMDGLEAAAHLQERISIPIIFLTAHGDDDTSNRAMHIPRDRFIRFVIKPFDEDTLRIAIENALQPRAP